MRPFNKLKTWKQKWHRIKYNLQHIWWAVERPFNAVWEWVRYHTWDRQHMLDCSSPINGYDYGYNEIDDLILFASFNLLKKFVEEQYEPYLEIADPVSLEAYLAKNSSQENWPEERQMLMDSYNRDLEVHELYTWWTKGRKAEWGLVSELYNKVRDLDAVKGDFLKLLNQKQMSPEWETWVDAKDMLDTRDQEMLQRLINVRTTLWT